MKVMEKICLTVLVLLNTGNALAQEVSFGGQVRPRFEFRDPVAKGHDTFTSMRVRAQVTAALERDVKVLIQFQDVRLWGEEKNTLGDFRADNLDLHQGYLELGKVGGSPWSACIGRQEVSLGGQRLIGAVGWTPQARAFDGMRLTMSGESGKLDVLGMRLADATVAHISQNAYLAGAYARMSGFGGAALEPYVLYNRVSNGGDTDQVTLGVRCFGKQGQVTYRLEGSYQTGDRNGQDVAAFMLGGRIGASVGDKKGQVTLWYDYLSGDDDPADGEAKVFDTMFATNHKFYGFADLFLNIPAHTGGLGLQDLAVKTRFLPRPDVTVAADVHAFLLAKDGGMSSRRLGEEVDLTVTYRYSRQVTCVGGFSYVFARDGLGKIGRANEDAKFGYVMTNVAF